MRIGIDAREFKKGAYTGLRTILQNFLTSAAGIGEDEFVFFCNQYTDLEALPAVGEKILIKEVCTFFWDQFLLPAALRKRNIQVFFSPYIKTPFWRVCPYVNTVADIIPLVVPKRRGIMAVLEKIYFFLYAFVCSHRSAKVITISEHTKKRVSEIFGIDPAKIKVIYPSVDPSRFKKEDSTKSGLIERHNIKKSYILYVGNFKPHKNLSNLITAFKLLPRDVKDAHILLLVGGSRESVAGLEKEIIKEGLTGKVIPVPAGIDEDEKSALIKNASLFVFPSLVEGFGIPPVEAMAAGVPVAVSNLAPMTEALGDAALFFDPASPKSISDAICEILAKKDLREQYIRRGLERASLFDPKDMSQKIMDTVRDAGRGKTLLISSEFPPIRGGISTHMYNLWKRLPVGEVVVLTGKPSSSRANEKENLEIIRASYPLGSDIISRFLRTAFLSCIVWQQNCARNIRKNHCAQVISAGFAGLVAKKLKGVPFVVYVYSADILEFSRNFFTGWILRKVCRESERIIANSDFTRSLIVGHGLSKEDKITVSTPGVDIKKFNPEKGEGGIRTKYGIPRDKKMLLTVSRIAARKGHEIIIKTLPGILESNPDVVYVIVGDGPERGRLETLTKEKGLAGKVIFTGEVSPEELVYFYNACDIFIMASRHIKEEGDIEGFGIVFLEANACGKPVIAGKSGGVSEAVVDGQTGILVDPSDARQIRKSVVRLLNDEEYARKLGNNGLSRVGKDFSWDTRAAELQDYI